MVKVMYCASFWGHLHNFHLPHIRELEGIGCEVHLVANGLPDRAGHNHNVPMEKSILSLKNIYVIFLIARLIRKERFDYIYLHTTLAAFLCRLALLLSVVRETQLIYVCHGYFFNTNEDGSVKKSPKSFFYFLCERLLAGLTPVLVLMNREDYASAVRYRLGGRILFSHGMGLVPDRYSLPGKRNRDNGKVIFLCVGELSARKNQSQLLRAYALARKEIPDSELWFAGDGFLREKCEKLSEKLDLTGHVRFYGHVEGISQMYSAANILVSSSRCEGLPFCVMEGLYFGLPSILSGIKGHRDLIKNGENGFLYHPDDIAELAGLMVTLGSSKKERDRLSRQASLPEEYFIDAVMEEFREITGLPVSEEAQNRIAERAGVSYEFNIGNNGRVSP